LKETSIKGLERLNKITSVMASTAEEIKKKLPKIYSKDLIEILFRLPYTKRQNLIDENIGNPKTVGNYLIAFGGTWIFEFCKSGKRKIICKPGLIEDIRK